MPSRLFENHDDAAIHVFDLPQIHTQPAPHVLLETLSLLTSQPPSWEASDTEEADTSANALAKRRRRSSAFRPPPARVDEAGLTRYLTNIIGSDLRWIDDDTTKEEIWEQASLRLSERSGRNAMPAMSRAFRIPSAKGEIKVTIHEPALTADNLGLKTWASSYMLAKRLHRIPVSSTITTDCPVLELGSGTGLVGIAAAAVWGASVMLTDLPEIVPNLARNIDANQKAIEATGGSASAAVLDWSTPDEISPLTPASSPFDANCSASRFPIILAADSLYSSEHPQLLVQTIKRWLRESADARVIVELPLREAYSPEIDDFKERMQGIGLRILDEGEEVGYDDWGWSSSGRSGQQENPSFVLEKAGQVKFEDRPVPEIKSPHDVIVEVKYTGICGSDVHYWTTGAIGSFVVTSPMVLGHESSGIIHSVGSAVSLSPGDHVAMEPGVPCRRCTRCKEGHYNLCADMAFAATPPYDGTLARYYCLPEDFCYKLPEGMTLEEGALVEPLAVAVHIVKQGAKIVTVDINEERLAFAQKYAATAAFRSQKESAEESAARLIKECGLGDGADVIIDASGAEICIQTAVHALRVGGTYVQGGMGKPEITWPIVAMCTKELNVKGSFRYSSGDYKLAVDLVSSGKIDVKALITGRVKFEEAEQAFRDVKAGKGIKILIEGPSS
ncbi:hypothetical protein H2199_002512 [Coniosporium tulheliwenetii]|uniref:Uncharacterized protein n=1 Tax=Coniosporium tulheliwenetii TaxID=3383036 RepID=A0ACC2ZGE9_9PEZI|nr:hypothetical protein H2199_002512 [Cladosporium sp. JES 115]